MTVARESAPSMSPSEVQELVARGPYGDGSLWAAVTPDEIEYGTPVVDLVNQAYGFNDFIEAAAIAGDVGKSDTGIALVIRAADMFDRKRAREATERDHTAAVERS